MSAALKDERIFEAKEEELPSPSSTKFVALIGSPNAGKTSVFNHLTGSKFRTVNYPGATVDYSYGQTRTEWGETFSVVDTPGTYSLFPKSFEEEITLKVLYEHPKLGSAHAVIAVIDVTQLSRHLVLVKQLIESGFRVVVALSMMDLLKNAGKELCLKDLESNLGCPIVPINGLNGSGVQDLVKLTRKLLLLEKAESKKLTEWKPSEIEMAARDCLDLEGRYVKKLRESELDSLLITRGIDKFLLHPFFGIFIFIAVMIGLFSSIFWAAAPFMDWIDSGFSSMAEQILNLNAGNLFFDFLGNGIVASMGAVLVFVPQIFILFAGISILEDSGYLARAAALVDKPLSLIGLNGRAFVPLLSGYACAIPAMLAARTIPSRKERWLTLFIIPLMSCSARIPVYGLLLSFLFWSEAAWKPGLAMAGIYLCSLFVGAAACAMLAKVRKFDEKSFFILELPYYRRPQILKTIKTAWARTSAYLRKAGPAIFVFAVIIWAGTTFPNYQAQSDFEKLETSYAARTGRLIEPAMTPIGGDWRTGVSLIAAFAAREVFVPSLAVILNVTDDNEETAQQSLLEKMQSAKRADGSALFTFSSTIGLIIIFMIALQCMATVGVARKEFGDWKTPLIQLVSFNIIAYFLALAVVWTLRSIGFS